MSSRTSKTSPPSNSKSSSSTEKVDRKAQKLIAQLRDKFLSEVQYNPGDYHPIDIERIRAEDWQIRRYLDENDNDVDKSYNHLCRSMKWKKDNGVHNYRDDYWPREFYESAGAEVVGETLDNGYMIQWEVLRTQYDFPELHEFYKQCLATGCEKYDRIVGDKGMICVIDAANMGVCNVSLDITKFKNDLRENYPGLCRAVYIVDHAWYLLPITKMMFAAMSWKLRRMIQYISSEALQEFIDVKHIPKALKGDRENYVPVCGSAPSIAEQPVMDRLNIDEDFVEKFFETTKLRRGS